MIMYHGTSLKRGKQILEDRAIRKDSKKVYDEDHPLPTTKGYIYLTNDIINAVDYGNKTAWIDKDERFIIFCMDIDKNILEADKDDVKFKFKALNLEGKFRNIDEPTLDESLEHVRSARVGDDIDFNSNKISYTEIISTFYMPHDEDELMRRQAIIEVLSLKRSRTEDADILREEFINRLEWTSL